MSVCVFTSGSNLYYKQSGAMDLLPLKISTTHIPFPISWHLLMLPVSSEFPWIPTTKLPCSSTLDHILSSSFTSSAKNWTILILLEIIYLILLLTITLSFVPPKRTILFFVDPNFKEQIIPTFYNALLDSLPEKV